MYFIQAGEEKKFVNPIPKQHANETEVCLKLGGMSEKDGYHTVNIHMINPTNKPISFTGYSESSPWYKIQRRVNGKWVDHPVGWFWGTGLRPCVISSGQSSVIPVYLKKGLLPIRVGVEYASGMNPKKQLHIVWSRKIEHP